MSGRALAWISWLERATPWPEPRPSGWLARGAWLAGALALLAGALLVRPIPQGDALEYLLMTESLARHGTPEARAGDVLSLARQDARLALGLPYANVTTGYFDDPSGAWYSCHFWAYSLLAVPARLLLPAIGANGLRAFPVTNVLLLTLALHRVLFTPHARPRARLALFGLLLGSPVLFFLRWPHPEAITVAVTTLALVELQRGRHPRAALWAALGSLQSPPLLLLLALVWAVAAARERRPRAVAAVSLAAAPAALAPLFYWTHFGTPSLIARESASLANLSPGRALELALDLNIGLLPYLPLTLPLFAVAAGAALARARRAPLDAAIVATSALMALASTATGNWNHGTIGPSRYAVWLLPLVLVPIVRLGDTLRRPTARAAFGAALTLSVASQAALVALKGGPLAEPDYLRHSAAARFVLRHAPALYSPSREVFAARTTHAPRPPLPPYVFLDGESCRKALVRRRRQDLDELARRCGGLPAAAADWLAGAPESDDWRYVDY